MKGCINKVCDQKKNALVSIIIPVYNGEKFIEESIQSCLDQTYENIEVIVVNDGSTDSTLAIIKVMEENNNKVKVISYDKNQGKVHALNKGVEFAKGEYIAVQAADDICFDYRIAAELEKMHSETNCVLVYGDMEVVDEHLNVLQQSFSKENGISYYKNNQTIHLLQSNFVSGGTILIDARVKDKLFPMPTSLKYEDWWISVVASLYGEIYFLNRPVIKYRKHSSNDNNRTVHTRKEMIQQRVNVTTRNLEYYKCFKELLEQNEAVEDPIQAIGMMKLSKLRDEMIINQSILQRIKLMVSMERENFKYLKGKEKLKLYGYLILGKNLLWIKYR